MTSKIDERWFIQRFHHHFEIQADQAQSCWRVTEANGRKLFPDVADRFATLDGTRIETADQVEQWLFPLSGNEQELQALLGHACDDAEGERERLAVLLETRQLAPFEAVVLPSAYPGQWVVALHAVTASGRTVPIRLPKPEQYDQVHPTYQQKSDAETYARYLLHTYSMETSTTNLLQQDNEFPQQQQKLSALIRQGASLRPEVRDAYVGVVMQRNDLSTLVFGTCPLGAAYEAATGMLPHDGIQKEELYQSLKAATGIDLSKEVLPDGIPLDGFIDYLSLKHMLDREQIADLLSAAGY
jgi:hypothetical protein